MVRRTAYGRPPEEREQRIPVPVFDCDPVYVTTGLSATRRINDNFEYMKVEVRIELPCAPNETDIRETINYATGLIDELVNGAEDDLGVQPLADTQTLPQHQPGTPIA